MEIETDDIPIMGEVIICNEHGHRQRRRRIRSSMKRISTTEQPDKPCGNVPFMIFDGKDIQITTMDGRKYFARKKLKRDFTIYNVMLYGNEYDTEIQKPVKYGPVSGKLTGLKSTDKSKTKSKPPLVTLDSESETDVEIVDVVTRNGFRRSSSTNALHPNENDVDEVELQGKKGKVEGKPASAKLLHNTFADKHTRKAQVFCMDNLSYAEEPEMNWFISHLDHNVMDQGKQIVMWRAAIRFKVPRSDLPITQLFDVHVIKPDELIDICRVLRRAFFTFLRRAGIMYNFMYPQVESSVMAEVLIQLWLCLTLPERELFYYRNPTAGFDAEIFNILIRFPPGLLEKKILAMVYPGGVRASNPPTYNQIFHSFLQVKVEAEQRRQADDMAALAESTSAYANGHAHTISVRASFEFEEHEVKDSELFSSQPIMRISV